MAQEHLLSRRPQHGPNAHGWHSLHTCQGWQQMWQTGLQWAKRKVVQPLVGYLRQGTEPRLLALSAAMGLTFGVFPIVGLTAASCGLAALALRGNCHIPTMLLVNMLVTPLELSLIIPFMRLGETLLGAAPLPLSPSAVWDFLSGHGSSTLLAAMGHALLGWITVAPFLLYASFRIFVPIMQTLSRRFASGAHLPPGEHSHMDESEVSQGRTSALNGTAQVRRNLEHSDPSRDSLEGP